MIALKFCKKHGISFFKLKQNVKKLYGVADLKESENIPWNLTSEILNYRGKGNNKTAGHVSKKRQDRRTLLPFIIEKEPIPPNKKRVEISTPVGGKVRKK
jgi:hypothetical protein